MSAVAPERRKALELVGIDKRFGGVRALSEAALVAYEGEILGLCGENGAGKSTLLKIVSGVHPWGTWRGTMRVFGEEQQPRSTVDSRRAGIAIVHQELMLVPELSVAANLALGSEPLRFGLIDDAAAYTRARTLLERFGFAGEIDPATPVGELGIGLRQVVEIVRALSYETRILVLDEPTAALTERETQRLMAWLRDLRARGTTCIYVSHRLGEIFALCDRITVLRDGRTAGTVVTAETSSEEVIGLMVGRRLETKRAPDPPPADAKICLEISDLSVGLASAASAPATGPGAEAGRRAVHQVSLAVREGELVALFGAMGSGRTALLATLFGCARGPVTGTVRLGGENLDLGSPRAAIAQGLALLPEDRKGLGLVLEMTVAENLALPWLASRRVMGPGAGLGLVDALAERRLGERRIAELRIRGDADAPVATLSGGNQQKVVLGKWLEHPPKILLLDEPTRGVDVGAREEIYGILGELLRRGVAVLLASSDLAEVLRLAHRIVVLRHGRSVGELLGAEASEQALVQLATGAPAAAPS
ncbi:MAG: sugar ABC transporter ATP-binding protein [Deltaproteobacteria bacterium]|nr:sugar ABC transporter ATP-binding protein [Deltaproteobacteria bacterium]